MTRIAEWPHNNGRWVIASLPLILPARLLQAPSIRAALGCCPTLHNRPQAMTQLRALIYLSLFSWAALLSGCDRPERVALNDGLEVAAVGMTAASLSNNGQFAVIGSLYHGISFWRLSDRERLFDWSHQADQITTLVSAHISANQQWALTADTHNLALWNINNGEGTRYWRAPGTVLSAQLNQDASAALLGLSDHTAVLFDIRRGGILRTLQHQNRVRSVALSEDGSIAVTGSEDYTAVAWDLTTGEAMARIQHQDDVQLVALSPDGTLALSVSKYDKALIWETQTGRELGEIPLGAERLKRGLRFTSARFSADNKLLLTGRPDQIVSLWRVSDLSAQKHWRLPKRKAWKPTGSSVLDLAFAQEGERFYAVSSNGFIFSLEY